MNLLSPIDIAGIALRNRIAVAPMSRTQADAHGHPAAETAAYYARYARHGAGLVITEALYTAGPAARAYFNQPGLASEAQAEHWRAAVRAVHQEGGRVIAQLQHAGKLAEPGLHARPLGLVDGAAQGLSWQTQQPNAPAHAATAEEIERIIEGFALSARLAHYAGFDGVEIHGARGYLVNDFLSAYNVRDDEWGADRARIAEAVLRAVRQACPLPIGFNYSIYKIDEYRYQPPGGGAEIAALLARLCQAGADILHISSRRVLKPEPWGGLLAQLARAAAPKALMVNGGLATLQDCETVLAATQADLVSLARPFLANPDWLARSLAGEPLRAYEPGMEQRPLLD